MKTLVYSATIVVVLIVSSCYLRDSQFGIRGEGPMVERKINLEKIKGISLPGSAKVFLTQGSSQEIRISGSGSVIYKGNPRVNTSISGSGSVRER